MFFLGSGVGSWISMGAFKMGSMAGNEAGISSTRRESVGRDPISLLGQSMTRKSAASRPFITEIGHNCADMPW